MIKFRPVGCVERDTKSRSPKALESRRHQVAGLKRRGRQKRLLYMKSGMVQSRNSDVNGGIQLIGMITRAFLCLLIIASSLSPCSQAQDREGSAEISGKVTVDGKPAADVVLVLSRTRTNERREERMMQ